MIGDGVADFAETKIVKLDERRLPCCFTSTFFCIYFTIKNLLQYFLILQVLDSVSDIFFTSFDAGAVEQYNTSLKDYMKQK